MTEDKHMQKAREIVAGLYVDWTWDGQSTEEESAIKAIASALSEAYRSGVEAEGGVGIRLLQTVHAIRQNEWCPDQKPDLSFRGNEMAGECGEACNVIKKLERERHGWRGSRATTEQLAEELADLVHTAILCAITAGIDLESAVVEKFDATSAKNGLQTTLATAIRKP